MPKRLGKASISTMPPSLRLPTVMRQPDIPGAAMHSHQDPVISTPMSQGSMIHGSPEGIS